MHSNRLVCGALAGADGHPGIPGHQQHATGEDRTTHQPHDKAWMAGLKGLDEGVSQGAVLIDRTPHQALGDAIDPHRGDVQHGAQGGQPEVRIYQADAVHLLALIELGNHVIQRADGDHCHPAQSTSVDMADGPVGVVRQGVNRLDRHHRTFESRHTVERQRNHQKTQDRVGAQLMPGTRQRHHAVDHAAPAGCQEDDRHRHTQRLRPVRQGGVMQVVRASPDIQGDDGPEVHDGQPVGVNRSRSLFGHEVIHHAEETHRQNKAHHTVPVPPLDHCIGGTGIDRVRLQQADGNRQVIDHMHHARDDDECPVEPVADIDVLDRTPRDGAKEQVSISQPNDAHPQGYRPLHLGIFLGGGDA